LYEGKTKINNNQISPEGSMSIFDTTGGDYPSGFSYTFENTTDMYYRMLLAALDLGWQVEDPVYLHQCFNRTDRWVYHFVLNHDLISHIQLITTPKSPDIERLISQEGWKVHQDPIQLDSNC
jgi:hypothetical protein